MNKQHIKNFFSVVRARIKEIAGLHEDTDIEATILSIKKAVEFRGSNIWVLAFAIIVASVGLNVNSTAVIIGAMLISPLMGPINGLGLAIGISDSDLLRKSLKNLLIMVFISILASTTYFLLSPLSDAQSELLARTRPTLFDVLIAFFGGAAGIVALSRKEQSISVISGVAIATALMPPLCTAGFGIAGGEMKYFFGAFYLFFINSFFIALATFLVVRYLKFPQKEYLDSNRRRLVKRGIMIFTIIVMVPSLFLAIGVIRESSFNSQTIKYINEIKKNAIFDEVELVNYNKEYNRKSPKLYLSLVGKQLGEKEVEFLHQELNKFGLDKTQLIIKQTGGIIDPEMQSGILENLLVKKDRQIQQRDSLIFELKQQQQDKSMQQNIYKQLAKEIAIQYPDISSFSVSEMIQIDGTAPFSKLIIQWKSQPDSMQEIQLREWLKVRLTIDDLQ